MIQITIPNRGIIHLPVPPADDANTIRGNCHHGVSLFSDCWRCEFVPRPKMPCYRPFCNDPQCDREHGIDIWQENSELFKGV